MKLVSKIAMVMALAAIAIIGLAGLSSCGSNEKSLEDTVWHFESMNPSETAFDGLNEQELSDLNANNEMLSVFMMDAEVAIGKDGKFTFTFLGDNYEGTWEKKDHGIHVTMDENDYSSASGTYEPKDGKLIFTADENAGRLAGYTVVYAEGEYVEPNKPEVTEEKSEVTDDKTKSEDSKNTDVKKEESTGKDAQK